MKPPILLERAFKALDWDGLKSGSYFVLVLVTVGVFGLLIFGMVRDTVTYQDKQCVAKYGSTDWDHQSVSTGKDTTKGTCVNIKTHEQKPAAD